VKAPRWTIPVLAGATVILVCANAFPTVLRKHRLQTERNRLIRELDRERERGRELRGRVEALSHDRFYLQRVLAETWHTTPPGAIEWRPGQSRHP